MVRYANQNRKNREYKDFLKLPREVIIRTIKSKDSQYLPKNKEALNSTLLAQVIPSKKPYIKPEIIEIYVDRLFKRIGEESRPSPQEQQSSRGARILTVVFALFHELLDCIQDDYLMEPISFKFEGEVKV